MVEHGFSRAMATLDDVRAMVKDLHQRLASFEQKAVVIDNAIAQRMTEVKKNRCRAETLARPE